MGHLFFCHSHVFLHLKWVIFVLPKFSKFLFVFCSHPTENPIKFKANKSKHRRQNEFTSYHHRWSAAGDHLWAFQASALEDSGRLFNGEQALAFDLLALQGASTGRNQQSFVRTMAPFRPDDRRERTVSTGDVLSFGEQAVAFEYQVPSAKWPQVWIRYKRSEQVQTSRTSEFWNRVFVSKKYLFESSKVKSSNHLTVYLLRSLLWR